jgi:hypothetical protein
MLVAVRTLVLHYAQDQIAQHPIEIRDQLTTTGKIESRLRQLQRIDASPVSTAAREYRLSWLVPLIVQDSAAHRQIRQLEADLDRLLDEQAPSCATSPASARSQQPTMIVEVGSPFRFARESTFAPLVRHRRRRYLVRRGRWTSRATSSRLRGQPTYPQCALHRLGHPATRPAIGP